MKLLNPAAATELKRLSLAIMYAITTAATVLDVSIIFSTYRVKKLYRRACKISHFDTICFKILVTQI